MNDLNHLDPAFDPRIADWLEADPDRAPREVLDTVLAAMPSIPQRRAYRSSRRFSDMNRLALFGVAAAIVVAVGLGGLVMTTRGPNTGHVDATPSPIAPSPSLPALTKQLTSGRHGYSIKYPDGWRPSQRRTPRSRPDTRHLLSGRSRVLGMSRLIARSDPG